MTGGGSYTVQCGRFFQWPILGDSEGVMMERGETSDALKNTFLFYLYSLSEVVILLVVKYIDEDYQSPTTSTVNNPLTSHLL